MRCHSSTIIDRMIRAALRVTACRYRVVACGQDHRGRIIGICTNAPYLRSHGLHAEARLIKRSPRSLSRILIARVNREGKLLAIDPCESCAKLAAKLGIVIESLRS